MDSLNTNLPTFTQVMEKVVAKYKPNDSFRKLFRKGKFVGFITKLPYTKTTQKILLDVNQELILFKSMNSVDVVYKIVRNSSGFILQVRF